MFGFLIGTASLIGLVKVARHGRGYGRFGRGFGGYRRGFGGGFGGFDSDSGPARWVLRGLSARIDATPAQEKVIREAINEVSTAASKVRDTLKDGRSEIAQSLKGDKFDSEKLAELEVKQDAALEDMRKTVSAALQKVHEALDPKQREILADLLENGPRGSRGGGRGPFGRGRWGRWNDEASPVSDTTQL